MRWLLFMRGIWSRTIPDRIVGTWDYDIGYSSSRTRVQPQVNNYLPKKHQSSGSTWGAQIHRTLGKWPEFSSATIFRQKGNLLEIPLGYLRGVRDEGR